MSFRERVLAGTGNDRWTIGLATHLGTPIENETCAPALRLPPLRERREQEFAQYWTRCRPPIAGYNCFGHVFASRRTTIFNPDYVDQILEEDGYGLVAGIDECCPGDVVVYLDSEGPTHVAFVVRIDSILNLGGRVPIVLSKFDNVSGEYEHPIGDTKWHHSAVHHRIYRPRSQAPRRPATGWREKIRDRS